MVLVKNYEPFYTQVWCSETDEFVAKSIFTSTEVRVKSFVQAGKIFLVKNKEKVTAPGFVNYERNEIVCTVTLNKENHG